MSTTANTTKTTSAASTATASVQHNSNSRSHCCAAEKENNDLLSPPLTPKEDSHHDPAVVCCPSHHNRKGFIQAYAQMVPHLRPVDSRMYGKTNKPATAVTSSPPSSIDDWLAAHYHSEKHQQIFTFDLCKLLAPLRQSKRKRQQEDDLEEEEQEEASLSSSDDASSIITTSSSSSSSSSHKNAFTAAAVAATVSRKKSKIAASVNTNKSNHNSGSSSSNPSSSEESHHRSNGGKAPARRNTRDLSIKGFTIDPQYTFDNIDIDAQDHEFYPQGWLPLTDRLDHVPVDINWKGKPLKLDANDPYYGRLHHTEADVISHMRLSPQLYLRCKRAIIMAAREFSMLGLEFRKSDAQKVCRIDVNKSSRLWAAFNAYGWLKPNTTATLSTCT